MTLPSLIAFGALSPWPTSEHLDLLRHALQHQNSLKPITKLAQELPSLWAALSQQHPSLHSIEGKAAAQQFAMWITGACETLDKRGNITRMPLTIIAHIAHYVAFLHQGDEPLGHESIIEQVKAGGGIQGFCIGLLSALAVASGKTEEDVGEFAAISVQLAFCIGAFVDLDSYNHENGAKTSTLAVRWKTPTTLEDIQNLLSNYPNTYIAVIRDVRDVTITAPAPAVKQLLTDLSHEGAFVRDIGVSGRYHFPDHEDIPLQIMRTCQTRWSTTLASHALVRSNTDAQFLSDGKGIHSALKCILVERADWYLTMCTATSSLNDRTETPFILSIGVDAVPQSIAKSFAVVKGATVGHNSAGATEGSQTPTSEQELAANAKSPEYPADAVAILGMGCRFPGADSIDDFWELLTEGKSMLSEIPQARFGPSHPARSKEDSRFWGSFLRDVEGFDHGFFKKSSREAASMDPQQRILLEVAYEALESSGYFAAGSPRCEDVGCYIGACATDYDFNVASHPPNAYSAIGTLRSFLSGKLSHYFGWSGPSIVMDTACSSSAVAIHTACNALRTHQCSTALAGGITLMTSSYLYENFSAAHFLSPTGGSKPFSADADGYGRGEGGGLVVLKRLSDALRDDDHILGVIAGSAVNQNDNCVPITVPHTTSQGNLYERVTKQAGIAPRKVTFVEAHGTGTPVGDPIEMESIRRIFGAPDRDLPLIVSSAKGNIGHLEGASGVAALIKAILQIEHRIAPRQASFRTLNPKIAPLGPDNLHIPISNMELSGEQLAACINNYGAAGSNAAIVLLEAPCTYQSKTKPKISPPRPSKYPIQLAAASAGSLSAYCAALDRLCNKLKHDEKVSQQAQETFSDLAYSLASRLNQDLPYLLAFTASSLHQLQVQLCQDKPTGSLIKQRSTKPPSIVLCFGGQVSDRVALDEHLWNGSTLLRSYLDRCDGTLRAMGFPGIYPDIFYDRAVNDVVVLHSIIFALQYSCAQAWLESGLKAKALVGHSFGQLTALCVSGILSLEDGLKLVAGRASLMRKHWGSESGTMIAVETDEQTLKELRSIMRTSDHDFDFEIACLNGPTSHVVVSDEASAGRLETKMTQQAIRFKRLSVPFGFHSRFTEPLLWHLEDLASQLTFHEPKIPLETCTDKRTWTEPTAKLIAAHTREPVFFGQAIERLSATLGPCSWVEAGSDSSVVSMVRRALGKPAAPINNFVPLQLNRPSSTDSVSEATVTLWNAGHHIQFWNFHRSQRRQYNRLRLPPYTWENSKHWLALDMSAAISKPSVSSPKPTKAQVDHPPVLMLLESVDSGGHHFVIGANSEEFQTIVKDFESSENALCPSALFVELACRAVKAADDGHKNGTLSVRQLEVHSPITQPNEKLAIRLNIQRSAQGWYFRITSTNGPLDGSRPAETRHAEGIVKLQAVDDSLDEEFCRYERLIGGRDNFASITDDPRSDSLQGNVLYRMLARATKYPFWYRGVRSMVATNSRVFARVKIPAGVPEIISKDTVIQLPLFESFIQVAGLHSNCLQEGFYDNGLFRLSRIDYFKWTSSFDGTSTEASWDVVSYISSKAGDLAYDMFIHDAVTGRLMMLMLGVHFTNVRPKSSTLHGSKMAVTPPEKTEFSPKKQAQPSPQLQTVYPGGSAKRDVRKSIYEDICSILESLADVLREQISGDATFDGLDIDSLMIIEIISELSSLFRVELPIDEMVELTDINSLVEYLHGKGCKGSSATDDVDENSLSSSESASTGLSSALDSEPSGATTPPALTDDSKEFGTDVVAGTSDGTATRILDTDSQSFTQVFENLRFDFGKHAVQTGAKDFWKNVYPQQAELVSKYVTDAFRDLGCDLGELNAGQRLPSIDVLSRHKHLLAQLRHILVDSGVLQLQGSEVYVRTTKTLDPTPATALYERMLQEHPIYAAETRILNVTGPRLADCLRGKKDPLTLLFGDKRNLALLADFYANSPMCKAATRLLADFVRSASRVKQSGDTLYILEIGAGTGGTTKHLVDFLTDSGVSFEYTFTDISQALVSQAKRNFSDFPQMRYTTFDCGRPATQELLRKFHLVISTNCIHATSNITDSARNILPTLREDGALCLVEFTRNLYWFDLVFGLLEGWWLFSDGREHALASEWSWGSKLHAAGFKLVSWTDGPTEEERTLRLVCAFKGKAKDECNLPRQNAAITKRAGIPMQEVVWKSVGALELSADIYFPKTPDPPGKKRPIALLIHGGGHFLFGRKDVPMKHIRTLIERGFLPISTDYRLCPESNLFDGPMADCCDALAWATTTLPNLPLAGPTVRPDPDKVVSLGWSSGGQLAMSLGYAAPGKGIKAPDAIIALYPPSDMESDHWHKPCYPLAAEENPTEISDILAGVRKNPIVEYAPVSEKRTMALSLTLKDDRARIILHMCWNSQTIPILVHGLPHKENISASDKTDWRYRPAASTEQVQAISPLWQIRQGKYKTPTFIAHGNADDWLPLSMSERTIEELKSRGIPANLAIPKGCRHAFDLFPVGDPLGVGWTAIEQGYDFICSQLGMSH